VGDFKNAGREWELKDQPAEVRVHDFEIREPDKGKVAPYGVYDLGRNVGWVSVGVDHDTAAFGGRKYSPRLVGAGWALAAIRRRNAC